MSIELQIETEGFCLCSDAGLEPFWIKAKDGTIVCQRCRHVQGYAEPDPPPEVDPEVKAKRSHHK